MTKGKNGSVNKDETDRKRKTSLDKNDKKKKLNPQEMAQLEEEFNKIFARKRYEDMDSVFKKTSPSRRVTILLPTIHVWEEWCSLPPIPQLCDSVDEVKPKPRPPTPPEMGPEEVPIPITPHTFFKPCILRGLVYLKKDQLGKGEKLYAEVCSRLRYNSDNTTDPLQPLLTCSVVDFREHMRLYPIDFEKDVELTNLNQRLTHKCIHEVPGCHAYAFQFNLSMLADSIKFNRPGQETCSGIVWEATAFVSKQYHLQNMNDRATIEFCKYTYAPLVSPESPLRNSPVENSYRYSTPRDPGTVVLEGKLPRDIFYHEEYIPVTVSVTNTSTRLSVSCVIVSVEQIVRTYKDTLQEVNLLIAEEYYDIHTPQSSLPVVGKIKNWNRTVFLRPMAESVKHRYNLLLEGRLMKEREYLASSTVMLTPDPVDRTPAYKKYAPPTEIWTDNTGARRSRIFYKNVLPLEVPPPLTEDRNEKKVSPNINEKEGRRKKKEKGKKDNKNTSNASEWNVDTNVSNNKTEKDSSDKELPSKGKSLPKKSVLAPPLEKLIHNDIEFQMCNKDRRRAVFVSYDVVVRLNLSLTCGKGVGGHPTVRLPFVLTRRTTLNHLSHSGVPEGYFNPPPDPTQMGSKKVSPR